MKFACVFPGQGSQSVGMMAELAEAYPVVTELFAKASAVLGYDLMGYWSDIGTVERYEQAEQDVRAGLIRLDDRQLGVT